MGKFDPCKHTIILPYFNSTLIEAQKTTWDSMDSNLLYLHVLVSCQEAAAAERKRSLRRCMVSCTWLCKWFAQSDEPTHAAPQLSILSYTFHASSSSKSWCQWEPPHFIGKIRVPQWRVKGVSVSKNSCIVLQQHHCHCHPQAHSQVWFGAKLITMLQAKWFVYVKTLQLQSSSSLHNSKAWSFKNHGPQWLPAFRQKCHQEQSLRDISKVFKCVLKLGLHQTSDLKEESGLRVRFEDTSWSNRHDSCVQEWKSFHVSWMRLIASTLIFVWVVQPLELFQVTASHLVLIQSKGPATRGVRGIARLGLRRLSWTFQGQSWVSERSEGHVVKSFYSSCLLKGMRHEQL